jgi:hypothetical protein
MFPSNQPGPFRGSIMSPAAVPAHLRATTRGFFVARAVVDGEAVEARTTNGWSRAGTGGGPGSSLSAPIGLRRRRIACR